MASLPKLPRRALGSTGISLSVLGFGASPFGGNFGDVTDEQCVEAAHTAFNLGINYFDTSPFYGATKSETRLGLALKGLPRDQVVISTKVGRYGEETFDFSAERVTASVHESLARLQTDYIDLILCHDIEHGDLDTVINETLPALVRLREQGLVRHIGITGYPLKIFRYVLDRVPPGVVSVVLSYCHHSLNDMTLLELLPYLQEKGVGVINASPLSMGLLTLAGPPPWHPAPQEVRDTCQKAAQHAKSRGVDIAKLALAAALRNADIATTLVGMASADMVAANARNALQALGAVETPQAALEEAVAGEVADLLAPVMNQAWPSGRPQNN